MTRVEISRRCGAFALLLVTASLCAGCSGKGAGDTVPSPPRDLVDKSFHPPAGAGPTGATGARSDASSPAPAGK